MSPPRKFSGKVYPGCGIDKTEGENFTRKSQDPWTQQSRGVDYVPGDGVKRSDRLDLRGRGAYVNEDKILRNKPEGSGTGDKHDIWSDVERNSNDVSETGGTGPVRFGVDK